MKIIAVTNQKGGSCKTTTAALIARSLAATGRDVLCLDCDPQGGLSSLLEAPKGPGMVEALMGAEVVPLVASGVRILTASYKLDKVAYTLGPYELRDLVKNYTAEYIIMDTPPTVQGISRAAAVAAGVVLVPTDISKTSMGPTLYTLEALGTIDKVGRVLFIGKEPKPDAHGYTADLFEQFKKSTGKAFAGILPRTTTAQKAAAGVSRVPAALSEIIRGLV